MQCQYQRLRFYKSEKTDVLGVWDNANYQPFSAKILTGNAETPKTPKHQKGHSGPRMSVTPFKLWGHSPSWGDEHQKSGCCQVDVGTLAFKKIPHFSF